MVRSAFQTYVEALHHLLSVTERCSIKGWPDRKEALLTAFRLQKLMSQRETMRFSDLAERRPAECLSYRSIARLWQRLLKEWSEHEDSALSGVNPEYRRTLEEIAKAQRSMDSTYLAGPLQAVQRDAEYLQARKKMAEAIKTVDVQLESVGRDI